MLRFRKIWRASLGEQRCAYTVVFFLALLLIGYLIFGPKPWVDGIAAQLDSEGSLRPRHYVVTFFWWGAAVDLLIALGVIVVGPLLFRNLPADMPAPATVGLDRRSRMGVLIGLIIAAALSGWLQAPRLSFSLWGDEEYTAKRFVAGYYRRDADGGLELRQPSWIDTAWDYRRGPTNHQLFSVLSRLSHSFHQPSDDPKEVYFSEPLIRLPSFLASLGTIFAVGWLVALLGSPRGAVLAGFVLALHPWFLRYGPEARGYALMMLLMPLCLIFLYKAATGGRWRHWVAFGILEVLCFSSYIGTVHSIIMLNLAGLLLVLFGQSRRSARAPQFGRFVVSGLIAAGLVIFLLSPIVQPTREWLARSAETGAWGGSPNMAWVKDVLCDLACGLPWYSWDVDNPLSLNLSDSPRFLVVPLLGMAAAFALMGFARMWRQSPRTRLLLPAMVLAPVMMVLHAKLADSFLFGWYLLIGLPALVTLIGLGMDGVICLGRSPGARKGIGVAIAVAYFGLLIATTHERVHLLRSQAVEPVYESVAMTRKIINPANPAIDDDVITVGFAMWAEAYDPAAWRVETVDDLLAALESARTTKRELYLNFGQYLLAKANEPEIMALIEDESLFEQVAVLHGLWQPCTRWIYRALPQQQPQRQ